MLDWIGSLRLREHTELRVVLSLSQATHVVGWALLCCGVYLGVLAWQVSPWLIPLPGGMAVLGLLLATLRRRIVLDRTAGVLRVDQRTLGLSNCAVVPLLHLRAVVIIARPVAAAIPLMSPPRFVAYIDRRVGDAIFLDESRRCAGLLRMAEAIADVAEVRLEYNATPRAVADDG
jgi:hypothetical protein